MGFKYVNLVTLLLLIDVDFGLAWSWPFSSADPEEFKHENVRSLTKDNFEDYVRTHFNLKGTLTDQR